MYYQPRPEQCLKYFQKGVHMSPSEKYGPDDLEYVIRIENPGGC